MGEHGLVRRGACVEPRVGVNVARDHLPSASLAKRAGDSSLRFFARQSENCPESSSWRGRGLEAPGCEGSGGRCVRNEDYIKPLELLHREEDVERVVGRTKMLLPR